MPTRSQKDQSQSGGTTVLTTLEERLQMYQQARSNAMTSGDSSKARRLDRGLHVSVCCIHFIVNLLNLLCYTVMDNMCTVNSVLLLCWLGNSVGIHPVKTFASELLGRGQLANPVLPGKWTLGWYVRVFTVLTF